MNQELKARYCTIKKKKKKRGSGDGEGVNQELKVWYCTIKMKQKTGVGSGGCEPGKKQQ